MNGFTVELTSIAEDQLSDIWLLAPDRAAVTAAEAAIFRILTRDPFAQAEEVSEGLLKVTISPLTVYYEADAPRKTVEIQAVAYSP